MDSPKVPRIFHKRPRFSSAPGDSIDQLNHLCSTSRRTAKMSQNRFHNNTGSFNNTNSFNNVWNNCTVADERSQMLTWLSPLEPRLRHKDIQESRVKGVGEWVLQTKEFRSWCTGSGESESDKPVLFFYGDPGVGKTFIRYQGRTSMNGSQRASADRL